MTERFANSTEHEQVNLNLQRAMDAAILSVGLREREEQPKGTIVPIYGSDNHDRLRFLGETLAIAWKGAELCGEVSPDRFGERPPLWPEEGTYTGKKLKWRKVVKSALGKHFETFVPEAIDVLKKLIDGTPLNDEELAFVEGPLAQFVGVRSNNAGAATV